MKLKEGFVTHKVGDKYISVAVGDATAALNGMVRCNEFANDVFQRLKQETTEREVVAALVEEYDAAGDVVEESVHTVVEQLRSEGLLDE